MHIYIYIYIYTYIHTDRVQVHMPMVSFDVTPRSFSRQDSFTGIVFATWQQCLGDTLRHQRDTGSKRCLSNVYGWNHRRAVHWFPIFYQWGDNLLLCQALRRQALVSFQLLLASGPCLKILMWRKKVRCRARVKSGGKGINLKTISW